MNYKYILTAVLIMSVFSGTASAWLSGYDHRMAITVNNGEASPLSYYQFNFTNDTNTLVAAGHMQASGADCRVTDASDNLIPFWNETPFNAAGTLIWANATTLAVGDNTFYIYYGNSGAIDVSDIATTFMFGDDFSAVDPIESIFGDWSACRATYIVGDTAYVTERNGLHAVNISDPENPVLRGFVSLGTGSINDGSLDVNVIGNYAFVSVRSNHKLSVVDISNPDSLVEVGNVISATYLKDNHGIYALGDYVYCCPYCMAAAGYLTIVNVSNKTNPAIEGYVAHATALKGVHDVYVEGNYAYVNSHFSGSSGSNGTFTIVDVSNKASPSVVSYIDSADLYGAADVQKQGDYCYVYGLVVSSGIYSIHSIDVSDVNNPFVADSVANCQMYVGAIYDNHLYTVKGGYLYVVNIANPLSLSLVKTYAPPIAGSECEHVFLTADGAYIVMASWRQSPATDGYYIINRTDMLATAGVNADNWDTSGASGTWSIDNNTLKAAGSGSASMMSSYSAPAEYIFEMKMKKSDVRNIYGYSRLVNLTLDDMVAGSMVNVSHDSRELRIDENDITLVQDTAAVAWTWGDWYNFKLVDNSGVYIFTTEKLDGSDSHTINNASAVDFTGNLGLGIYDGNGHFDNVRARKYTDIEPTATLGAAETQTGGGAYNITLPLGWSIIGWTDSTDRTAHYIGGLIGGNCSYVTERNRTTGLYVNHNMAGPESENNFAIERGWGYFVSTTAETLWERDT